MQTTVNVTSIEYGTITVDAPDNATNAEIEELATEMFNNGDTDWADQENYIEVDAKRLPRLVFQSSTIYQLVSCDEQRSADSMTTTSPIAVAVDQTDFADMLVKDLENDAKHLSESNEQFFASLDPDSNYYPQKVLTAYLNQQIDYRHVVRLNLGYNTN